jgi:hypothetical protein
MSKADEFRQYAEDNLRWARQSTTDKDKTALLELAHHWMRAALQSESDVVEQFGPRRHRAL